MVVVHFKLVTVGEMVEAASKDRVGWRAKQESVSPSSLIYYKNLT